MSDVGFSKITSNTAVECPHLQFFLLSFIYFSVETLPFYRMQ